MKSSLIGRKIRKQTQPCTFITYQCKTRVMLCTSEFAFYRVSVYTNASSFLVCVLNYAACSIISFLRYLPSFSESVLRYLRRLFTAGSLLEWNQNCCYKHAFLDKFLVSPKDLCGLPGPVGNFCWLDVVSGEMVYYSVCFRHEGLAGCGHSKIAHVRAYYLYCMFLALLTSV